MRVCFEGRQLPIEGTYSSLSNKIAKQHYFSNVQLVVIRGANELTVN
jgi:hypothetical protein